MTRISEPVLKYLQDRPGRITTTGEITEGTGLERIQVQGALSNLTRKGLIERRAASIYVFTGADNTAGNPLFEQLAITKNGDFVLQSEDGDVIVARPIQ